MGFSIDPMEEVEPISAILVQVFPRNVFIKEKRSAINQAKANHAKLVL